jgi:hypothetical protein
MEQKNTVTLLSGKQWLLILLVSILLLGTMALMYSKFLSTKTTHAATPAGTIQVTIHNHVTGTTADKVSGATSSPFCLGVDDGTDGSSTDANFAPSFGTTVTIVPYQGGDCDHGTALPYNVTVTIPANPTFTACDVTFTTGKGADVSCK